MTYLDEIELFRALPPDELKKLDSKLQERLLAEEEELFHLGDPGDELFVIVEGKVAIYAPQEDDGPIRPIRIFGKGEALGELALLDNKPRSMTAKAITDSKALILRGEDFRELVTSGPDISLVFMSGLADKIRYTTQFLNAVRKWVGRIQEGDYGDDHFVEDITDWADHLTDDMERDETIKLMATEFARMAATVQKRETELKGKIFRLQIAIDSAKRDEEVAKITQSELFQSLKEKTQDLRRDLKSDLHAEDEQS